MRNAGEAKAAEERAAVAQPAKPRGDVTPPERGIVGNDVVGFMLWQWEKRNLSPWRFRLSYWWREHARGTRMALLLLSTFLLGALLASTPELEIRYLELADRAAKQQNELRARRGELELARLELARLNRILQYSGAHDVPADLAASIYDIALAEGIDPKLAFGLVSVESEFFPRAVSPVGAVGLTQVMPTTAFWLQPGIRYQELFEEDTNLRLGFRYLRMLIRQYDGDLRLALLAYNRGPAKVDGILKGGGDPSNGYARAVNRKAARAD